jgi:hypothetical protein
MTTVQDNEVAERLRLPNPDDMSIVHFFQHMMLRHGDSMPEGFVLRPDAVSAYVEECWRLFHERLHRLRAPDNYDHRHIAKREDED